MVWLVVALGMERVDRSIRHLRAIGMDRAKRMVGLERAVWNLRLFWMERTIWN
jgi:hypothetical protein